MLFCATATAASAQVCAGFPVGHPGSELMYELRLDSIRGVVQQIARDQPNAEGRALGQSILEAYQDSLRSARSRLTLAERELRQFLR